MQYKIACSSGAKAGLDASSMGHDNEPSAAPAGINEALWLDAKKAEIFCNGVSCTLKPTPSRLMHMLVQHSGQIVSRRAIYKEIWGYNFDPGTKIIEVQVYYLRSVLTRIKSSFEIKTYRGKGICLQRSAQC